MHRLRRAARRRGAHREGRLSLAIRPARPEEAPWLTELALRSKAHWGHDDAFLERARRELTITAEEIRRGLVRVAERDGAPVAFSALDLAARPPELVALFVEPAAIGTGAGRALLARARDEAVASGAAELVIESDPDAEGFYLAQGAERVGERRSSSTGRLLPLLRLATRR